MLNLTHTAKIRNQNIRWGSIGNGPPLVAIHGTPFSSQVWRNIAPILAQHWTIYYFDLAGYGQSEMCDGQDVSLGIQNNILAGLLQHWGIENPDVLAHDFGGATALRGYFLNDLTYASLTLIDPVALAPWGSPFVQHVRQYDTAFATLPDYMHKALLEAYLQGATHQRMQQADLDIYASPWLTPHGKPAFYRQIAQMDQRYTDEIEMLYQPLSCPVNVIWGEQDQWIPIAKGERLAGMISSNPLQRIANAGHLVQEDCPQAIIAAMLNLKLTQKAPLY